MDELVTVWELHMMGQRLCFESLALLTDALANDLDGLCVGDEEELTIRVREMQRCDLDALPDFEGW